VGREHLETLREGHASFNRGDTSWAQEQVAEDVVWGTTGAFPGMEKVYRGPDGVEEWVRTVREEWESFRVSMDEVLAETSDLLAVVERIWGKGRGSGAEGEMKVYTVYRFNEDGKISRRQSYTTREEAAAAL
jgi:ketosteroid isomerase-like protein